MSASPVKRKLTTILAADVVGYSKLMASDEEGTFRSLINFREFIKDLVAKHSGRIFNEVGDAFLVEFDSAVEAVRCAIAMQEDLAARNVEWPDDQQMWFRIGINVGDVMIDDDNLLGDGVNVAARLEGISQTGGICISGSTFEQVKNKLSIGFEDIGPQNVKNIPHPVSAYQIIPAGVSVRTNKEPVASSSDPASLRGPVDPKGAKKLSRLALGGAIAAGIIAIGAGVLLVGKYYSGGEVAKLAVLPDSFSTKEMTADEIRSIIRGMAIQGIGGKSGNPFVIKLEAGGVAKVRVTRKRNSSLIRNEVGRWWAEDNRFCMQFPGWAQKRMVCPHLRKENHKITVHRRKDGTTLNWTVIK